MGKVAKKRIGEGDAVMSDSAGMSGGVGQEERVRIFPFYGFSFRSSGRLSGRASCPLVPVAEYDRKGSDGGASPEPSLTIVSDSAGMGASGVGKRVRILLPGMSQLRPDYFLIFRINMP